MKAYQKLLLNNKAWASEKLNDDPDYFKRLTDIQTPDYLWIGCSDSRVPTDQITGTQPGEIFVHRNIANMVVHTDLNLLSVLEYAVHYLRVKHIILCGHYNCGGVKAAMSNQSFGIIDSWIRNIKDVHRIYEKEIDSITDEKLKLNKVIELNVREQVLNLAKTSIVQKAWKSYKAPDIHGWVYDLKDGLINPIIEMNAGSLEDSVYQYDNL